jgi:hypothetical protein
MITDVYLYREGLHSLQHMWPGIVLLSNSTPNHHTRRLSTVTLNNAGSQIGFAMVASNTYVAIIVGKLLLSMPVTAFIYPW